MIYSCLKSIKATKNIHHELVDLRESIDPTLQTIYQELFDKLVNYYRQIITVTLHIPNGVPTHNYELLLQTFGMIKQIHSEFGELFISFNNGKGSEEFHLTSLINIDHYIYETLEMLFIATAHIYLPEGEVEKLEKTVDVDEEIYESFTTDPND